MMRQMDTTHLPDRSCDYITKKAGTIYEGSCTFLCLAEKQSVLFTAIRVTCWISRLISLIKKLIATRTKIDFRILMRNRYTPNPYHGKICDQITFCTRVPREPRIVRYLLTQAFTLQQKYNNYQIKVEEFLC